MLLISTGKSFTFPLCVDLKELNFPSFPILSEIIRIKLAIWEAVGVAFRTWSLESGRPGVESRFYGHCWGQPVAAPLSAPQVLHLLK